MDFKIGNWCVHIHWVGDWHLGFVSGPDGFFSNIGPVMFDVVPAVR